MIPPGWNVTEPLSLAASLYRVVESLRAAPEDAKAFTAQIENFGRLLNQLQKVIDESLALDPGEDHEDLRATLANCQSCVQRCQKFQDSFQKLRNAENARMVNAGQVALWVWNDRKIVRLRQEIDSQMQSINLSLTCKIFTDGRSRHGSVATLGAPYGQQIHSSGASKTRQVEDPNGTPRQSFTPSDLLGLDHFVELPSSLRLTPFELDSETITSKRVERSISSDIYHEADTLELPSPQSLQPKSRSASMNAVQGLPQSSSTAQSQVLDQLQSLPPSRASTLVASSPASSSTWNSPSVFTSSISACTSTTKANINSDSRRGSLQSLNPLSADMILDNLKGATLSYIKGKDRFTYQVERFELRRDSLSRLRYIIVVLPTASSIKFYQKISHLDRLLPHTEHPIAYEGNKRRRVKFLGAHPLSIQHLETCLNSSSASPNLSMSPHRSHHSSNETSPTLRAMIRQLKSESQHVEYDFDTDSDYYQFQELIMGHDIHLCFHKPIEKITIKKTGSIKSTHDCETQNLRIWKYPTRQTMMFYANIAETYREFDLQHLRPVKSKSKIELRLDVQLPDQPRRKSRSKSSGSIDTADVSGGVSTVEEPASNDLTGVNYVTVTFSYPEDKAAFLVAADFCG